MTWFLKIFNFNEDTDEITKNINFNIILHEVKLVYKINGKY